VTRAQVRRGVAEFFGGTTFDEANKIYRPTRLASYGLGGVRPYYPVRFEDTDRFAGLETGAQAGALLAVHLPEYTERRLSNGGFMDVPLEVQLYLFHLALGPRVEEAQEHLDNLVQAVIDKMRGDPTLGGAVTQAGETARGITVSLSIPVTEPAARTEQTAVIAFTANTYPFYPTPS
jgi:hypothetical protein